MELREIFLTAAENIRNNYTGYCCNAITLLEDDGIITKEESDLALGIFRHVFKPARIQNDGDAYWRDGDAGFTQFKQMKISMLEYLAEAWSEYYYNGRLI